MATPKEEYFTKTLDSLIDYNHCHGTPQSIKDPQEAVSRFMEEEEKYAKHNVNNVTKDDFFQSPVTINAQKKYVNVKNERRIALDIHAETIK